MLKMSQVRQFSQLLPPSEFKQYLNEYLDQPDIKLIDGQHDVNMKPIIESWPMQVRLDLKRQCAAIIVQHWGPGAITANVEQSSSPLGLHLGLFSYSPDTDSDSASMGSLEPCSPTSGVMTASPISLDASGDGGIIRTRWDRHIDQMTQQAARRYLDTFRFDPEFNMVYGTPAQMALESFIPNNTVEHIHSNDINDNAEIDYCAALREFPAMLRICSAHKFHESDSDDFVIERSWMPEFHHESYQP